jgi:hypothetical protein
VLESAAAEKRPIVLYFPDEQDSPTVIYGEDLAELSRTSAMFIKVPYNADRTKSPWAKESAVPINKLLSENPSREYNIPVGRATVLICDWYGNEYNRVGTNVRAPQLSQMLEQVKTRVERTNDNLQRTLERATKAHEEGNRRVALRHVMSNLSQGHVGLPAQEATVHLYHKILDDARDEIKVMVEEGNQQGLRELAREFRGTDLKDEIDEAMEKAVKN